MRLTVVKPNGQFLQKWRGRRKQFITTTELLSFHGAMFAVGLSAFIYRLLIALFLVICVAFLIIGADICDAQTYELFGEVHNGEFWYIARALYAGAGILFGMGVICLSQGATCLACAMDLRLKTPKKNKRYQ